MTPTNGMCMWYSLAAFLHTSAFSIKKTIVARMREDGGLGRLKGQLMKDLIMKDTNLDWLPYLDQIEEGKIWPGFVELKYAAQEYQADVEVYTETRGIHKLVAKIQAGRKPAEQRWPLCWEDQCHYVPLTGEVAPWPQQEQDEHKEERSRRFVEQDTVTILAGNISSFAKHSGSLFWMMEKTGAAHAAITETRLATFGAANHQISAAKLSAAWSAPRPMKTNGAPREGGAAFLSKQPLAQWKDVTAANAVHTMIQIGARLHMHVFVLYAEDYNDEVRQDTLTAAAALGRVPAIVVGDWNTELINGTTKSPAVQLALASGCWFDIQTTLGTPTPPTTHGGPVAPPG